MEPTSQLASIIQGVYVCIKGVAVVRAILKGPIRRHSKWLTNVEPVTRLILERHHEIPVQILRDFVDLHNQFWEQKTVIERQLKVKTAIFNIPALIKSWRQVNTYAVLGRIVCTKGESISELANVQRTLCERTHGPRAANESCPECTPDVSEEERQQLLKALKVINGMDFLPVDDPTSKSEFEDAWEEVFTRGTVIVDVPGIGIMELPLHDDAAEAEPPRYEAEDSSDVCSLPSFRTPPWPSAEAEVSEAHTERQTAIWMDLSERLQRKDDDLRWDTESWSSRVR